MTFEDIPHACNFCGGVHDPKLVATQAREMVELRTWAKNVWPIVDLFLRVKERPAAFTTAAGADEFAGAQAIRAEARRLGVDDPRREIPRRALAEKLGVER